MLRGGTGRRGCLPGGGHGGLRRRGWIRSGAAEASAAFQAGWVVKRPSSINGTGARRLTGGRRGVGRAMAKGSNRGVKSQVDTKSPSRHAPCRPASRCSRQAIRRAPFQAAASPKCRQCGAFRNGDALLLWGPGSRQGPPAAAKAPRIAATHPIPHPTPPGGQARTIVSSNLLSRPSSVRCDPLLSVRLGPTACHCHWAAPPMPPQHPSHSSSTCLRVTCVSGNSQ